MKRPGPGRSVVPRELLTPGDLVRRACFPLGFVGLSLALAATATSAHAASTTHWSVAPAEGIGATVDPALVAGYLAEPGGGLETASLRFKVPTVKCKGEEARAVSIGLGDVQDLQSSRVRAHVMLTCPGGARAEFALSAQACSDAVGPLPTKHGHKISVTLAQAGGTITATVTDETEGISITATDSSASCEPSGPIDSVLFGALPVFAPALLDVPDFNKVKSRDATLNDADLSGVRIDRETNPGIRTSKLRTLPRADVAADSKKSGEAFSLRYRDIVHCCLKASAVAGAPQRAI